MFYRKTLSKSSGANVRYVEIDGAGPILLERSKRAKRLVLSVKLHKGVRVAVPGEIAIRDDDEAVECIALGVQLQVARTGVVDELHRLR